MADQHGSAHDIDNRFRPDYSAEQMQAFGIPASLYKGEGPRLASLPTWKQEWLSEHDPDGWVQWYSRYSAGRRLPEEDTRQIKRWLSFRARHGAAFSKNPTPRRGWALRNWAIDPANIPTPDGPDQVNAMLQQYRDKLVKREQEKEARCWKGYEPVPGKEPYSNDSCQPVGGKPKPKNKKVANDNYGLGDGVRDGASLAAAGTGAAFAMPLRDSIRNFGVAKRDMSAPMITPYEAVNKYRPQVGDVILSGNTREALGKSKGIVSSLMDTISGTNAHHAYTVLPSSDGTFGVAPVGMNTKRPSPVYNRVAAAYSTLVHKPTGGNAAGASAKRNQFYLNRPETWNWENLKKVPDRYSNRLETLKGLSTKWEQAGVIPLAEFMDRAASPLKVMYADQDGYHRVLRPKVPLTPEQQARLIFNSERGMQAGAVESDTLVTGLKNLIFGKGRHASGQRASTCAGGVCNAYEGIADLGNAQKALPADLAGSGYFDEVLRTGNKHVIEALPEINARALQNAKNLLKIRAAMVGIPLSAAAAFQVPRLFSGEKTSNEESVLPSSGAMFAGGVGGVAGGAALSAASNRMSTEVERLKGLFAGQIRAARDHAKRQVPVIDTELNEMRRLRRLWQGFANDPKSYMTSLGFNDKMKPEGMSKIDYATSHSRKEFIDYRDKARALRQRQRATAALPKSVAATSAGNIRNLARLGTGTRLAGGLATGLGVLGMSAGVGQGIANQFGGNQQVA